MSDVSFEIDEHGELVIYGDTETRHEIIAAMKKAVAKNTDEITPAAYTPPAGEDDTEAEASGDDETPEERRARIERERRRAEGNARSAAEGRRLLANTKVFKSQESTMSDLFEVIKKAGGAIQVCKAYNSGQYQFLNGDDIHRMLSDHWGDSFARNFSASTPDGLVARQAWQRARNRAWGEV